MDKHIKELRANENKLGEARKCQLDAMRHKYGRNVYAVSNARLLSKVELGRVYKLCLIPSKANYRNSFVGCSYNFSDYVFDSISSVNTLISSFVWYNCNDELGKKVNIYILVE